MLHPNPNPQILNAQPKLKPRRHTLEDPEPLLQIPFLEPLEHPTSPYANPTKAPTAAPLDKTY